jgi:hypothetical protein
VELHPLFPSRGYAQSPHRLTDRKTATITMPKKMSPQSWQMLLDTLELWKKQAADA